MSAQNTLPDPPQPEPLKPEQLFVNLPRDRATANAWYRGLYATDPEIATAIDFHATSLSSCFRLENPSNSGKAKPLFDTWWSEWFETGTFSLHGLLRELWLIGEVIVTADLNEEAMKWDSLKMQNPDYVNVRRTIVSGDVSLSLRPDQRLRDAILNKPDRYVKELAELDPKVIEAVKKGENIPLNNFYSSILMMKANPYEVRGTSILQRILKRYIDVGYADETIKLAIMYPGVKWEGTVMLDVLRNKYTMVGNMVSNWIAKKIFTPVCKINELYEYKDGEKSLIIPRAKFDITQAMNQMADSRH